MTMASPWERLLALLQLWDEQPGLAPVLIAELSQWCRDAGRCFLSPSSGQLQALACWWTQVRTQLPAEVGREIAFHLDRFK